MIQIFTFHVDLGPLWDEDPDAAVQRLRDQVKKLLPFQPVILGFTAQVQDKTIVMQLRICSKSRWHNISDAKRIAVLLSRRALLPWRNVTLQTWITEPNARALRLGEGRAVAAPPRRKPLSETRQRTAQWWGDDLSQDAGGSSGG